MPEKKTTTTMMKMFWRERVNSKIAKLIVYVGEQKKKKKTAANSRKIKGKFEGWTCKFPLLTFNLFIKITANYYSNLFYEGKSELCSRKKKW